MKPSYQNVPMVNNITNKCFSDLAPFLCSLLQQNSKQLFDITHQGNHLGLKFPTAAWPTLESTLVFQAHHISDTFTSKST